MEIVIIFLRFIKQTRPTSILHFFFILRILFSLLFVFPFFILCILFSLFFVFPFFILRIPFLSSSYFLFYNVLKALSNSEFSSFVPTVMRRQLWQRVMRVRLRTMIPLATR